MFKNHFPHCQATLWERALVATSYLQRRPLIPSVLEEQAVARMRRLAEELQELPVPWAIELCNEILCEANKWDV